MSYNTETFWLVMRVRRWENMAANGMDIAAAPELGTGYVCVFDTEAAARAACQDGDTVAAVRGKATNANLEAYTNRPNDISKAWWGTGK